MLFIYLEVLFYIKSTFHIHIYPQPQLQYKVTIHCLSVQSSLGKSLYAKSADSDFTTEILKKSGYSDCILKVRVDSDSTEILKSQVPSV